MSRRARTNVEGALVVDRHHAKACVAPRACSLRRVRSRSAAARRRRCRVRGACKKKKKKKEG
eukprot:994883-Prymnesium_polylepis.1